MGTNTQADPVKDSTAGSRGPGGQRASVPHDDGRRSGPLAVDASPAATAEARLQGFASDAAPPAWPGSGPLLLLALAFATANGALWMLSVPFHKGPDEAAHFQVIRFILDHGRLPAFRPDELWLIKVPAGVVETYATFPPLAYLLAAAASVPFRESAMWTSRLVSLAAYVGTVGLSFATARRLFPHDLRVPLLAALTVAALPQFAFVGAYVNNDALAALESAAVIWLLVRLRWSRPPLGQLAALGALVGALLVTKYTVYAVALVAALAPIAPAVRRPRELARRCAAVGVPAAAVSGWWFARNWTLYAELIPGRVVAEAKAQAGGNTLFVPANHGLNLVTLSTETDFWPVTLQSFMGVFGYMDLYLAPPFYWLGLAIAVLGATGAAARVIHGPVRRELWLAAGAGAGVVALTAFSTLAISAYGEYSPQGRYLFGALVPLAVALAAGWAWAARRHPALRLIPAFAASSALALNFVSLLGYVVPFHFGTGTETVIVQVDQPATPRPADAPIEVMGWSLVEGGTNWRPLTPDVIAAYRRPVSGVAIYLDGPPSVGRFQGTARYGFRRTDVAAMYGGAHVIERVGFRLVLPPGSVDEGIHRVYACATLPSRPAPTCTSREFVVRASHQPAGG